MGPSEVTPREREVWSLVARHLTNSEIAAELSLSVRTVETHVSALIRKLGVHDRRALARQADAGFDRRAPFRAWPSPTSSFVGRHAELTALAELLAAHRMVTVTGPGGVGKTRLAVEVAQSAAGQRRDGGYFVDLVPVSDPAMVVPAVARVLGVPDEHDRPLLDTVAAALAGSDAIVVLDNCEHLLDAARACVERLVTACPSLVVVATSRTRLLAPFEWVYAVPGLSVVGSGGDAVELFLERATAAGGGPIRDRDRVTGLCGSLDGVALAIELAAARYPSLGVDGLLAGLDRGLRVLAAGRRDGDRHSSMRDALAWSFDLLDSSDRALLGGVAVFASWFDLDAAVAVAEESRDRGRVADGLGRLAEHNLLVAAPGKPTRYRALEIIRQFASEQLELQGQGDAVRARHRQWCRDQLAALQGISPDEAWCERFDRVAPDVRAAISWAEEHGDPEAGDLAERLAGQLLLRGYPAEAQRRYEQAASHAAEGMDRTRLLRLAAGAAACRMVGNDTLRLLRAAADEAIAAGQPGVGAECLAWMSIFTREAPGIIANVPGVAEDQQTLAAASSAASGWPPAQAAVATATAFGIKDATAPESIEAASGAVALARAAKAPLVESAALDQLCAVHLARADYADALEALRQRERALDDVPLDAASAFQFNDFLLMASEVHLAVGDLSRAAAYADRLAALACYREQDHLAFARRIKVDGLAGDLEIAADRGERFAAAWGRAGRPIASNLGSTAYSVAMVHGLRGDERRRREFAEITDVLIQDHAFVAGCTTGWAPTLDALVLLDQGRPDLAMERLAADIDDAEIWGRWNTALWRPWYAAAWAEATVLSSQSDAEDRLRRALVAARENQIATVIIERARNLSAGNLEALPAHGRRLAELGCLYQARRTSDLADRQRSAARGSK